MPFAELETPRATYQTRQLLGSTDFLGQLLGPFGAGYLWLREDRTPAGGVRFLDFTGFTADVVVCALVRQTADSVFTIGRSNDADARPRRRDARALWEISRIADTLT